MIYPPLKATVRQGKIEFFEDVKLPENATLFVTVLSDGEMLPLSLGEHLIAGLNDILAGRVTEINTPAELDAYLDRVLGET